MTTTNKYIFYTSLFLNGVLLIFVFGFLSFFLYLSLLINLGLMWYLKKIMEKSGDLEDDVVDTVKQIEEFSNHIEELHELEMYYGDENLQKLIEHSRELINDFVDFQARHFDVEVVEEEEQEEDQAEEQEEGLHEEKT